MPGRISRATEVEDGILQRILTGEYAPGERLPNEREMADSFSVSRASIREGLKRLQLRGVVRTVHGSRGGSFVQRLDPSLIRDAMRLMLEMNGITIESLMEARMFLAPKVAALAAQRATDADIVELSILEQRLRDGERLAYYLVQQKLAEMSRNAALAAAMMPLVDLVDEVFIFARSKLNAETRAEFDATPQNRTRQLQLRLIQAVRNRDPALAQEMMSKVMESAYAGLRRLGIDFSAGIVQLSYELQPPAVERVLVGLNEGSKLSGSQRARVVNSS